MRYVLSKKLLGLNNEISISKKEFLALESARNVLRYTRDFEENYELIVSNYIELEKEIFNLTLDEMIRTTNSYLFVPAAIRQLNLRLINLLTSFRVYTDQINKNIPDELLKNSIGKDELKKHFSEEYDNNVNYRFMEALRNFVQHHGLPVHHLTTGGKWTSVKDDGVLEQYLQFYAVRSRLELDPKFKKGALEGLEEKIELQHATRSYLESISNVHIKVRSLINCHTESARNIILVAQNVYTNKYDDSVLGLEACKVSDENIIESIPLLLEWDDVRIQLQARNNKLSNLSRRRIVTLAPDDT